MIIQELISTNLSLFITMILWVEYAHGVRATNLRQLAETFYCGKEGRGMVIIFLIYTTWFVGIRLFIKQVGGV